MITLANRAALVNVGDAIDAILQAVPEIPTDKTVDNFIAGNRSTPVTSLATTFAASLEVIQNAIQIGANFIVTHEPTYYDPHDHVDWLGRDPVYHAKKDLIMKNGRSCHS